VCLQLKVSVNLIKELELVAKRLAHLFNIVWKLLELKVYSGKESTFCSDAMHIADWVAFT